MRARTPLTATEREPECDIAAQWEALLDSAHPKRAVWVSFMTDADVLLFDYVVELEAFHQLHLDAGTLYASEHDCGRLEDDPSEEMLAEILDYVAPKSVFWDSQGVAIYVVQARDAQDRVVLEMVADLERLGAAVERCRLYGEPRVLSLTDCLVRRRRLIAEEDCAAPSRHKTTL